MFSVKDEQDICRQYAEIIFKSSANKMEDVVHKISKYARSSVPTFGIGNEIGLDFELKFRLDDVKNSLIRRF